MLCPHPKTPSQNWHFNIIPVGIIVHYYMLRSEKHWPWVASEGLHREFINFRPRLLNVKYSGGYCAPNHFVNGESETLGGEVQCLREPTDHQSQE